MAIRVLYQRDYLHLLVKYGLEPPSQLADAGAPGDAARRCRLDTGAPRRRPAAPSTAAESA